MKASVIIPAYNAQETIKDLLDSLVSQDWPQKDFEVIVVDDGSTDQTAALVKKYPFVYLYQKNKGAGAARNLGAKKAQGEIFLFTDSDCVIPNHWVKIHLQLHQKNEDVSIIGGGVKKPKDGGYLAWADFLCSWFNAHEDLKRQEVEEYLPTLNLSVKRELFEKIGGFWEQKLTGEDVDFCFRARKIGAKILFEPRLAIWDQNRTLNGFLKHNFNWGYHASFVRGEEENLAYYSVLSGGFLKALLLFLPIVFGFCVFLGIAWRSYQPLRFLFCLPLILLGKLVYGFGFLAGSWQKSVRGK